MWSRVSLATAVLAALALWGCGKPGRLYTGPIASPTQMRDVQAKARELSLRPLQKHQAGVELTEADLRSLRSALELISPLADSTGSEFGPSALAGMISVALGDDVAAKTYLQRALAKAPDTDSPEVTQTLGELHAELADVELRAGNLEVAERQARMANEAFPNNADYLALQASIAYELEKRDEARELVDRALSLVPDHRRANALRLFMGSGAKPAASP